MNQHRPHDATDAALLAAVDVLSRTQEPGGSWKGDYSGPLFLPGMLVGTCHVLGHALDEDTRAGLVRYLRGVQAPDGSFGLGIENPGTVFTTTLSYVALRLLDVPEHDPACVAARQWVLDHGSPLAAASWGKFFLAVLGLYDWRGVSPVPPETWLLPRSLPVHPSRLWCHARMVYLPMSWLYATRATGPVTERIAALRGELYPQPWSRIDWAAARDRVAATDVATPRTPLLRLVDRGLRAWEHLVPDRIRAAARQEVLDRIRHEDEVTDAICIGPVNKLLNMLVWHFERPDGPELRAHLARLGDYLWTDDRGTRMNGYNSSELWDTAFAAQALLAAGRPEGDAALAGAWRYIEATQVREDVRAWARYDRCRSQGAWPFSTRAHGWPITDCTAEALKVALALHGRADPALSDDRFEDAVARLLAWQNPDGSWASYETTRGPAWLEQLNPSDVFRGIMIDHGHVECTSACLQALAAFRAARPTVLALEAERAILAGRDFLLARQAQDGSWQGAWGVCFTYGTWFGVLGLRASGLSAAHPAVQAAADYLLSIQHADGAWGEHVDSCRLGVSVPTDVGQAVMTSWALLALHAAARGGGTAAQRGLAWLIAAQRADGTWDDRHVAGVFNGTCSIHYDAYRKVFPLWALATLPRRS